MSSRNSRHSLNEFALELTTDPEATVGLSRIAASHLTVRNIVALSVVALLSLLGQVLVQWELRQQSSDARVINLAGRQRMLSQKLSKAALASEVATVPSVRKGHVEELRSVLTLWERSQTGLQRGDVELGLPGTNSPAVEQLFARIAPPYDAMLRAAKRLIAAAPEGADSPGDPDTSLLVKEILAEETVFLEGMSEIVFQYDREASDRLRNLKRVELMLLGTTLTVLLLIGLFLFRPTVRRIRQSISNLEQADRTLRVARDGLEAQVVARTVELSRTNDQLTRELVERKRAEEELRYSEEKFRSLVQHSSDLVTILGEDGTIQYASSSLERILGYKPEKLIGTDALKLVHPEDKGRVSEVFRAVLREPGVAAPARFRYLHKDGSWRVLEAIGNNLLGDSVVQGVVVNSRDITEQESITDQLRQAQKMEAVGQLSGGVAHDFNNLLMVIRGYNEMLLSQLGGTNPLRRYAEEVQRTSDRATSLTKQLLAFSRRQILEPKVLNLNAVVGDAKNMLRRLIGEDIELTMVQDPGLGFVRADPGQIQQIILNLAVNARDAMPRGGTLTLQTSTVELGETFARQHVGAEPGSYVQLTVSDTGAGMDPETLDHIFEPFFTTKGKDKGTGLGLATVYGIVKQSQGYISVWSEPSKGTAFKIYLPRIEVTEEDAKPEKVLVQVLQGSETIMVVEDEMSVRRLTRQFLVKDGYTVLEASDGEEALEIAAQYPDPIHLLLTDIVMPRMNGDELAKKLVTQRPGMKMLFMSGYADVPDILCGAQEQNVVILQKPFSQRTLACKVREVLTVKKGRELESPLSEIQAG